MGIQKETYTRIRRGIKRKLKEFEVWIRSLKEKDWKVVLKRNN